LFIDQIDSQNKAKNAQYSQFMAYANNPNVFALGLKDACCKEPLCCCASALGSPYGFTACWARSKILDTYHNGTADFICCQNYLPPCCCLQPAECCPGSALGLCLEGCCFPMTSLSVARLHMMDTKQIQPDPCDWQIIAFANFLQILSCLFHIAAIFAEEFRDAAAILDLIADLVKIVERLRAAGVEVVLQSTLACRDCGARTAQIRELNERLGAWAAEAAVRPGAPLQWLDLNASLADTDGRLRAELTYDGVHLNGPGYVAWRAAIAPRLGPR
jgi:hypothetical protein